MLLTVLIFIACITAFIILFIGKIGLRDYLIEHVKYKILGDLLSCDFCLCFWLSLVLSYIMFYTAPNLCLIALYTICSTVIARFLL